jgi:hypothetical protein
VDNNGWGPSWHRNDFAQGEVRGSTRCGDSRRARLFRRIDSTEINGGGLLWVPCARNTGSAAVGCEGLPVSGEPRTAGYLSGRPALGALETGKVMNPEW